ncbi:DEAD/DEAH box helicase family protein [Tumebacillus sp. ITR2]|uniref:DEAD/DEAH box helicase family protein n=1 Tax=Tumebacillus amylolyticus TaxID=2801339 RepID=A0ABS1J6K5_9BACL|nr:DEAD/DEAH box helicase family protein [Tumebacillus amylolyticus]MBL0385913.1 DEAD/DEAH box helicase family protein [Tumebacillus amylolyticus]
MYFKNTPVFIEGNSKLRSPQIEAYLKIQSHFAKSNEEALVVLPTGTGKSGLIAIAPFGISSGRVLIITPGKVTRNSIAKTMEILEDNFWINTEVIFDIEDNPVLLMYDNDVLNSELRATDIVYTNVQKLNKSYSNSLLNRVDRDFFDMVIVDEAHHAPANTWQEALTYFNKAKILHVTGTPYRGDGVKVPGKRIHETKLSEVMQQRYVKWLRNKTLSSGNISFIMENGTILSIQEARKLRDEEWVQKSVAMSDDCSLEVIKYSIQKLKELKELSPNVPHKIMAAACNIKHANRLFELYSTEGAKAIVIHSDLPDEVQEKRFKDIELHKCDVVINVGMMGEGYDHKYLTIAALFRPYRSLNQFAQIIGRVLRAIPSNEITKHEIDNNALVIYHKELGLDEKWKYFKDETEIASKYEKIREIEISEDEYEERKSIYGTAIVEGTLIEYDDSYSDAINFNHEFEKAKQSLSEELEKKKTDLLNLGWAEDDIDEALSKLGRKRSKAKSEELSRLYNEKRPLERRRKIRELLNEKINQISLELLVEFDVDPKGTNLFSKFARSLPRHIKPSTKNDGVLVIFINTKLKARFSGRNELDVDELIKVEEYLEDSLLGELRRILNGTR